MKRPVHQAMPLRRIVKREVQAGEPYVVMACGHAAPGRPSCSNARFYPCPTCDEAVRRYRAERLGDTP